jgi:hypothetical protein
MTAPERFAESRIPLALRAPSIHDPYDSQQELEDSKPSIAHLERQADATIGTVSNCTTMSTAGSAPTVPDR